MALQLIVFSQVLEAMKDLNTQPWSDQMHANKNITSKEKLQIQSRIIGKWTYTAWKDEKNLKDEPIHFTLKKVNI